MIRIVTLDKTFSGEVWVPLLSDLFKQLFLVLMIISKHTVSSKMVVSPFKDLKMVPTVHTSNQNVLESLLNSFLNVGEDVRNEEILLSTEHVLQKALLTLGLSFFLHMLDPQLLSFARTFVDLDVGIIIFIIFDAKDSVDNALKPTDDEHNIALLIDD